MIQIPFDADEDDHDFWIHTKKVFNRRFYSMNTPIHSLALFLHPLTRRFAISQAASGHSMQFLSKTALEVALKWRWKEETAKKLVNNLKFHSRFEGPFAGSQIDGLDWWKGLPIDSTSHPLKVFAIWILSIVPHAADVERLFSQLGGVQSVKRCNLTIENFEQLGKLRCNYSFHPYERAHKEGKPLQRKHGHMHTRTTPGIDAELVNELSKAFSYDGPFTTSFADADIDGPEAVSLDKLDTAFDNLEKEVAADVVSGNTGPGAGEGVLDGAVYSWDEFDKLEQGISPLTEAGEGGTWSIGNLLAAGGLGE